LSLKQQASVYRSCRCSGRECAAGCDRFDSRLTYSYHWIGTCGPVGPIAARPHLLLRSILSLPAHLPSLPSLLSIPFHSLSPTIVITLLHVGVQIESPPPPTHPHLSFCRATCILPRPNQLPITIPIPSAAISPSRKLFTTPFNLAEYLVSYLSAPVTLQTIYQARPR